MASEQIRLVQTRFENVGPMADTAVALFDARLFETGPSTHHRRRILSGDGIRRALRNGAGRRWIGAGGLAGAALIGDPYSGY